MKQLDDLSPMPFGKYKDTPMQDVPARYLHYLWTTGLNAKVKFDPVADYVKRNLHALKQEYEDGIWS